MKLLNFLKYPLRCLIDCLYAPRLIICPILGCLLWLINDLIQLNFQKRVSLSECQKVINWVKEQKIPANTVCQLQLPPHLAGIAKENVVQVIHTRDNRYCILLKTYIGYKKNFEGIFYSDNPLPEDEIEPSWDNYFFREYEGENSCKYDFYTLHIRNNLDDGRWEVYYNLS
jgi:hypothetical protein